MASRTTSVGVDQAGGTTAELIASKTGYKIQVTSYVLAVSGAAVTVKSTLQDTTANTVRTTIVGNASTPIVYTAGHGPDAPAFETAVSEGLELITGTAAVVQGHINYRYISA